MKKMRSRRSGAAGLATMLAILVGAAIMAAAGGCTPTGGTRPSSGEPRSDTLRVVTLQRAHELIQQNQANPNFVILDVRTAEEFESGHIEGAINIDYYHPGFRVELGKLDKTKAYLVYCRTSNRSQSTLVIMEELQFKEVYELDGGILTWRAAGFPLAGKKRQ